MVFFVCEGCNETLKRNQVEKHRCYARGSGFTCVDCSQTFYGATFNQHATCVSEAEKYEGSLFKKKAPKKSPQDMWMDALANAVTGAANAPESIRSYLPRLVQLGNVPRNRSKFFNFVKNSLRIYNDSTITSIWDFLESTAKKDLVAEQEANKKQHEKQVKKLEPAVVEEDVEAPALEVSEKKKKKKKRELEAVAETTEGEEELVKSSKKQKKREELEAELAAAQEEAEREEKRARKAMKKAKREREVQEAAGEELEALVDVNVSENKKSKKNKKAKRQDEPRED